MLTQERFLQGYDFSSYVAKLGDDGHKFAARFAKYSVAPEEASFFTGLAEPVNILVLSEGWCPDCVNNVPVLARIAELNSGLQLRIFPRDANLDVMDQFLTGGKRTIPTAVFLDRELREIGRWVERPAVVQAGLASENEAEKAVWKREYFQGKYLDEVAREVRAILACRV